MKQSILILIISTVIGFAVFSQTASIPAAKAAQNSLQATILEVAGKVEYQAPGAGWKTAKVGAVIVRGTMVSTGFKSTASIKVGEAVITVKPVTRLTLEELVRTEGGTQTALFLTSGRVQADVTPSKTEKVSFSIKSASATASVRGTGFEFDGYNLLVTHGMVELRNNWNQYRYVGGGEYSYLETDNSVSIPIAANPENGLAGLEKLVKQAKLEQDAQNLSTKVSEGPVTGTPSSSTTTTTGTLTLSLQ